MLEVCSCGAESGNAGASFNCENPHNCEEWFPNLNRVPGVPRLAGNAPRKVCAARCFSTQRSRAGLSSAAPPALMVTGFLA